MWFFEEPEPHTSPRWRHALPCWAWWGAGFVAGAITTLAVLTLTASAANAESLAGDRITIIDGDTVALPCARPFRGCAERVRIFNIDAPETFRPHCEAERAAGYAAKVRLAQLIRGNIVTISRCEPSTGRCTDRSGRTLASLAIPAGDIGQILIAERLALPWVPGKEARLGRITHWCGER